LVTSLTPKERILGLLKGEEIDRIPCFSGMGNVTTAGFQGLEYNFPQLHGDSKKMAEAAATSHRLFDFECAVVPFDLCVEAEAMGCVMNPYEDVKQLLYPTIKEKIVNSTDEMTTFEIPDNLAQRGRVPVVMDAIKRLKEDIGSEAAIGAYVLGPFTLAGQIMDLNDVVKLCLKKPDMINEMLDRLADVLITVGNAYEDAGADYICVREMGATTDVLSPRVFKKVIQPHLTKIFNNLNKPHILHICGGTNKIMDIMQETGAGALSVEQKNDLQSSRAAVGEDALIFGNIDAFNVLVSGTPEQVEEAVLAAIEGGVDAIWPSCDIWPEAPVVNLKAMTGAVKKYGAEKWARRNR